MPDKDIVWKSEVTRDMVKGFTEDEIELLIADLDDSVMATLSDYDKISDYDKGSHDEWWEPAIKPYA